MYKGSLIHVHGLPQSDSCTGVAQFMHRGSLILVQQLIVHKIYFFTQELLDSILAEDVAIMEMSTVTEEGLAAVKTKVGKGGGGGGVRGERRLLYSKMYLQSQIL